MGQDIYHNLMKHLGNVGIGYPQMGKDDFIKVAGMQKCEIVEEEVFGVSKFVVIIEKSEKNEISCQLCGGNLIVDQFFADRNTVLIRCQSCGEEYEKLR